MTVSLRHYRRHSVPIQYVSTLKNHEGGHPTGDHFTTKNPILSGESHDFSEGTAVRIKHAFLPQLSAAQMTGVFVSFSATTNFPPGRPSPTKASSRYIKSSGRCSVLARHEGLMAPAATSISVYCLYLFADLGNPLRILNDFLPVTILDLYNHGVR